MVGAMCPPMVIIWLMVGFFVAMYNHNERGYSMSESVVKGVIWPITAGIYLVKTAFREIRNALRN